MPTLSMQGVAASAAVAVAAVTHILTSRRARALDRAALVRQYSSEFATDREVIKLFVDIDHEGFRFDRAPAWLEAQQELILVRMLDLFNSLGHSWSRGLISLADIHGTTLGYAIVRAYNDPYIRKYIAYADGHHFGHVGTGAAFEFFRRLAVQLDEKLLREKKPDIRATEELPAAIDG